MRESAPLQLAPLELARLHAQLDAALPVWRQLPTDSLIWTRVGEWGSCTESKQTEAEAVRPKPR